MVRIEKFFLHHSLFTRAPTALFSNFFLIKLVRIQKVEKLIQFHNIVAMADTLEYDISAEVRGVMVS